MKRNFILITIALFACLVISFGKDIFIQKALEKGAEVMVGLRIKMGYFHLGILGQSVHMKKIQLMNPPGFPDKVMVDVPEIYVHYDLLSLIRGRIHLKKGVINLKEFIVEKDLKGQLNLDQLRLTQSQTKRQDKAEAKTISMRIDSLELKIDRVIFKDFSKGPNPQILEFNINLNEKYTNITDPNALIGLIVLKVLMNTTIGNLVNFDMRGLQGSLINSVGDVQKMAGATLGKAQTQMRQTTKLASEGAKQAEAAAKKAEETAKKAAGAIGDVFKNPFGSH